MNDFLLRLDGAVPSTYAEFYVVVGGCMVAFGIVAIIIGHLHHGRFDLYRLLRNGLGGGLAFPPAVLLILYPVSNHAQALLGAEAVKGALMLGGATTAVLILYGLLKK